MTCYTYHEGHEEHEGNRINSQCCLRELRERRGKKFCHEILGHCSQLWTV